MEDDEIVACIKMYSDTQAAAELINLANARGYDNITVVLELNWSADRLV